MEEKMKNGFVSESYGEVISDIEKRKQKREKEAKQKEFDEKLLQLADKAIEFREKRGQDDGLTVLLENFLEVALQMKSLMETMTAINVAMECVSDSIGFLDSAIDFDNNLMDESLKHNYSLHARLKAKRKMKKTIKNNCGRMIAIANGLSMKYKMATEMTTAMNKVSAKLKSTMKDAVIKANKKSSADKGETAMSPAEKFIQDRMKSKGKAEEAVTEEVTTTSDDKKDSGIDDIL